MNNDSIDLMTLIPRCNFTITGSKMFDVNYIVAIQYKSSLLEFKFLWGYADLHSCPNFWLNAKCNSLQVVSYSAQVYRICDIRIRSHTAALLKVLGCTRIKCDHLRMLQ